MPVNHTTGSPYVTAGGNSSNVTSEGPPTPTQELDVIDHRNSKRIAFCQK